MAQKFQDLNQLYAHTFDTVIDVRSPAEFAQDHLQGAINLPVLSNEERARVGTLYVQESPFLARKLGAALVFRNAADHIENSLSHNEGGWRPLIYCWRGGQRSGAFTWMLQQIGWRADVVDGGYRSYRRLVSACLYDHPLPYRLVALDGYTGTAKTDLLKRLQDRGVQVLDLEDLANHRGSLLGEMPGGQPSQKAFESRLAAELFNLDTNRPVVVEAESSKIGNLLLPPSVWSALRLASRIRIEAPVEARARYLALAYDDILSDGPRLKDRLSPLRYHRGHEVVDHWSELIDAGAKQDLTRALIEQHYDPAYLKSRRCNNAVLLANLSVSELDHAGLEQTTARIEALLTQV